MAKRRRYTDEQRAEALAALAANGGNVQLTVKQLGLPRKTLLNWVKAPPRSELALLGHEKRTDMASALDGVAWQLLDLLPTKAEQATLKETALALAIAIDKARLLRGESTNINEQRTDERLDEFRRRYANTRPNAG